MMCFQCGKRKARIEGLCEPCFLESQPPLFIKNLKLLNCRECGALYYGSWRDISLEKVIEEYVPVEDFDYRVEQHDMVVTVSVVARQTFHEKQTHAFVQQTQFTIHVKPSLCNQCSRMLSGYYQAVLQVRRQDRTLTEEERALADSLVVSSLKEKDFISRIKERKEGTDFYFSTSRAALRAAHILKKQLGGGVKESYAVVGMDRQKGVDIKRGTILFSLHKYKSGDMVMCQNEVFEVAGSSQKLHLKNGYSEKVLPWKKVEYLENENQLKMLSPSQYTVEDCQVIDVAPSQVLVLLPDFETRYMKRPKDIKVKAGNWYRILFFQEYAYWM
jgi:nonsense-mediated mRNA decay protein 3